MDKLEWAIADDVIREAYPDFYNKGYGWWGEVLIPNYGVLRVAIAKAIKEASQEATTNHKVLQNYIDINHV